MEMTKCDTNSFLHLLLSMVLFISSIELHRNVVNQILLSPAHILIHILFFYASNKAVVWRERRGIDFVLSAKSDFHAFLQT